MERIAIQDVGHTRPQHMRALGNDFIASTFNEYAELLEQQGADQFRIAAYRHGANTLISMHESVAEIYGNGGVSALVGLPTIGKGLASCIAELLLTGHWSRLERLRGSRHPSQLFQTIPGIGPKIALLIHDELGIDTLQELEAAAYDGRLENVPGVGPKRAHVVRAVLSDMLARPRAMSNRDPSHAPTIALLLAVDEEYREKASRGDLPTISPRRFNPGGKAWLPIMHNARDDWHFTVLFSNTARAHQLKRTQDWVVIYYDNDDHEEGQKTVVSETTGRLRGKRVVRGLEAECYLYYEEHATGAAVKRLQVT